MTATAFWCTDCLAERSREGACVCGAVTTIAAGAPGEHPLVVAHLSVLDAGPTPAQILSEACAGPRRFVGNGPFQTASWRHAGKTVWMWRGSLEDLPRMSNPAQLPMWRLLAQSRALLIDVPESSAHYQARYARNRRRARQVPAIGELLDNLQEKLDLCGGALRSAALFDPANAADDATKAILAARRTPASYKTYPQALQSLLPAATSQGIRPWPRVASASAGMTQQASGPLEVRIQTADVGGSVATHMLMRLHHMTSKNAGRRRMGVVTSGGLPIKGVASMEGRAAVHHWELRQCVEPPQGIVLPEWKGVFGHFWRTKGRLTVQPPTVFPYDEPTPTIIGIGPYRTVGEAQLMALIEKVWQGKVIPAAIIAHERCDQRLLEWVGHEFPSLPRFADHWEGNLAAVREVMLRVQRWRMSL